MGLFSKIEQEAERNFIARPEEAKDHIVYKYPEHNIRMMTQLTVNADEMALFIKDGKVQGKLESGRHTLTANNIPFLSNLLDKFTGGNLFVAEVYFVTLREIPSLKFGGPIGDVRDPETGLGIGTMVYGDFSIQVVDPEKLVIRLAGLRQSDDGYLSWFKDQVLKVIRDRTAELLVKKRWPLLDVTSGAYTEEIEAEVLAGVKPNMDPYGVDVARLGNFTISIKEDDEETLKKLSKDVAYSRLAGGYGQYAQAQAIMGAGKGMAKGGSASGAMLQGAGLGMGFGMAGMFGQQITHPAGVGPAGAAAPQSICPHCGTQGTGKFCNHCGQSMSNTQKCECGAELVAGAKFCASCGKPAATASAAQKCECGAELAAGAKFCASCGKPAPAAAAPQKCECGAELAPGAKFCPSCGKPAPA